MTQTLLPVVSGTPAGETAWEIGHRHAYAATGYKAGTIPRSERQAYSRGYTRGALLRVRHNARSH